MKKNPDWLTEAIDAHAYWTTTVRDTSKGPKLCIPETENLDGAYLRGAILNGVDLSNQSLVGADLVGASLFEANLRNANLRNADLRNADFWNANLRDANLENANLENANLRIATVRCATLIGANLSNVDLTGADLRQSDLKGANLRGAKIRDVVGDNVYLMSVQLPEYDINYTYDRLQIGCKNFSLLEWWGFDDRFIDTLDTGALDWWNTYKPILMSLIKANPATKD